MDATKDFYHGVIAALAVVELHQQDVLFDEIIGTMNETELIKVARRNGDMRWSGLSRYVKRIGDQRRARSDAAERLTDIR